MKKLILDEMNIKDIMNPIDLNEALYGTPTTTNIIVVDYKDETFIDLYKITVPDPDPEDEPETEPEDEPEGIDMFNNDYVVIAKADTKMYLKEIPINK